MDYEGPTAEDLANVAALNQSYLSLVPDAQASPGLQLPIAGIARLASAPFLLFTLREDDTEYWRRLLDPSGQLELQGDHPPAGDPGRDLRVAAAGLLWDLSRRNAFTARLVSGAPQWWCDAITGLTLLDLHRRVAMRHDLVRPRFPAGAPVWERLVAAGAVAEPALRRAAQFSALHDMLTRPPAAGAGPMRAAACRTPQVSHVSPGKHQPGRRL